MTSDERQVQVVFGGLSSDSQARELCARMAAAAQRWPQRRLLTEHGERHWFGRHAAKGESDTGSALGARGAVEISADAPTSLSPRLAIDRELGVITIRSGIAPLFYAAYSGGICFGSDPTLVRSALSRTLELDAVGLTSLLLLDHLPPSRSLFQEIHQLPPLSLVTGTAQGWSEPILQVQEWTRSLPRLGDVPASEAAAVFLDAVRSQPTNGVASLVPLTGGVDSRAIVAAATGIRRIETYTRGNGNDREVSTASRVARTVGVTHRSCPFPSDYLRTALPRISHLTGGAVGVQHGHAIHPIHAFAGDRFQSVLPGTNGEFGRAFWKADAFSEEVGSDAFWDGFFARTMKTNVSDFCSLLSDDWAERVLASVGPLKAEYAADLPVESISKEAVLDVTYLLRRVARFMMWGPYIWSSAAPVELPFLDDAYVRAAAGLSAAERSGPNVSCAILSQTHPALLQVPLEPSGRRMGLPRPSIWQRAVRKWERARGRAANSPQNYAEWLRREMPFVEELLGESEAAASGVFRQHEIRKLVEQHRQGADHAKFLMKILTVELALRVVRDGQPVDWERV